MRDVTLESKQLIQYQNNHVLSVIIDNKLNWHDHN